MEKITINIQDIISNPNYSPDEYINKLKSKHPEYSLEDLEELAVAFTKQTYENYANARVNNSEQADLILERIKYGHIPTKYEIFELMCDDPIKIEQYITLQTIKDRVNSNDVIAKEDFDTLSDIIGLDQETSEQIRLSFVNKGILVDEYIDKETEIQR